MEVDDVGGVSTAALPTTDGESRSSAESEKDVLSELNNRFSRFSVVSKAESHAFSESSGSFWTAPSFLASTRNSFSTYASALSGLRSSRESVINLSAESNFDKQIREAGLKPPPLEELDWSGKGQFVEFNAGETVPLEHRKEISSTAGAVIDEVMCRRIRLARKSMICRPKSRLQAALEEIGHLRRLDYAHIVRFVGAYVEGITISILTYPVAEWDLESFLRSFKYVSWDAEETSQHLPEKLSLVKMPTCLIHALAFVHTNSIRHLDIKPKNILVRKIPFGWRGDNTNPIMDRQLSPPHKVYLCDFGISTSFNSDRDTKTTSPTARTATYCAPEIDDDEAYSRAADVFSLGCVFAEIFTCAAAGETLENFADARAGITPGANSLKRSKSDRSFHANLARVNTWLMNLAVSSKTADLDLLALDLVFTDFNHNMLDKRGSVHIFGDSAPRDWSDCGAEPFDFNERYSMCDSFFEYGQSVYFLDIVMLMLRVDPNTRPTSYLLASKARRASCCEAKGEPFSQDSEYHKTAHPSKFTAAQLLV